MSNRPGYKHTPLGWIPEDWEVKSLEDVVGFLDGKRKPIKEADRSKIKGDYPYYGASGIIDYVNDYIFDDELILLGEDGANILNRSTPLAFKVKGKIWVNNHAHVLKPKNGAHIDYVTEFLESIRYDRYNTGTAQPKLNKEVCSQIPVLYPTSKEQCSIGRISTTWDEGISKAQQLIANLQQRNKGLMQQLLTGKKRLKGFEREWKGMHIYEIAGEVSLKNKEDKQLTVLSCTKYDGLVPSLEYFGRRVFGSDTSTYKVVPKEHFAYATNHIEEGSIGYQSIFDEALISPMYTVFKTTVEVNDNFLYKLLKSHQYIHQYRKRMEGSIDRRGGLRWDEFSKIPVHLPEIKEQAAIAKVLDAAVSEVKLYEQKLAAIQQQKKGLMQKLLTGEVRVKI
ncbi:MAG: restriction endonuclease subunit S [Sediminibacterium sp.]|nr:restriction endonuclease subunit S [Sediminibacterium sp.]